MGFDNGRLAVLTEDLQIHTELRDTKSGIKQLCISPSGKVDSSFPNWTVPVLIGDIIAGLTIREDLILYGKTERNSWELRGKEEILQGVETIKFCEDPEGRCRLFALGRRGDLMEINLKLSTAESSDLVLTRAIQHAVSRRMHCSSHKR